MARSAALLHRYVPSLSLLVACGKGTLLDGRSDELLGVFGFVTVRLARCEAMRNWYGTWRGTWCPVTCRCSTIILPTVANGYVARNQSRTQQRQVHWSTKSSGEFTGWILWTVRGIDWLWESSYNVQALDRADPGLCMIEQSKDYAAFLDW